MRSKFVASWLAGLLLLLCFCAAGAHAAETELAMRERIGNEVRDAFLRSDFAELERRAREYREQKSRTPSGLWKLTVFYGGLATAREALRVGDDPKTVYGNVYPIVDRWMKLYPSSPSAHLAFAQLLVAQAWEYRGSGWAKDVPPAAWKPFKLCISQARDHLERHKAVASVDPAWYQTMVGIASTESWGGDAFDRLVIEAVDREPLFYETYFAALRALLPKWGGSVEEVEAFAEFAVRRTRKTEGQGLYARIYWYASQAQWGDQLFSQTRVEWSSMRAGFEDVVRRYPDAWNLTNYAMFACLAGDKPKTRELLARVGQELVVQAWQPPELRARCLAWAR